MEGRKADLTIFKQTSLKIARKAKSKADSGYQGIKKIHPNSQTPIKKPKNGELTKKQKKKNKKLRKKRVKIEHTNRRCKCFRIVKETYRNHLNHITSVWLIVCGLVNLNL